MLHLTGYDLTLDDLRAFRQWGSKTPGHPERGHTDGVEVTTGPLGQGIGNAVGHGASPSGQLRARFGADLVDHRTFCVVGDGDLSEGLSHEAASLAGHLGLGRLVCVYDDNHVSIDGPTELSLSDDAGRPVRGLRLARRPPRRGGGGPRRHRGGAPAGHRRGGPAVARHRPQPHRLPVPVQDRRPRRPRLRPEGRRDHARPRPSWACPTSRSTCPTTSASCTAPPGARGRGRAGGMAEAPRRLRGRPRPRSTPASAPPGSRAGPMPLPTWTPGDKVATRVASGKVLQALADVVPSLLAGGADLTSNTGTVLKDHGVQSVDDPAGRQLYFGIREHAMAAVDERAGPARRRAARSGGTFLVFADYCRPSVRLAALSRRQGHLLLHPRLGRRRRGRPHPPAGRARGVAAGHPRPARDPARRRQRDRRGVAPRRRARRPDRADPVPPGPPGPRGHAPASASPRGAHVIRSAATTPTSSSWRRAARCTCAIAAAELLAAEGIHAQVTSLPCGSSSPSRPTLVPGQRCSLPTCPRSPSRRAPRSAGSGGPTTASAIDRFGASAPGERVLAELGFTPEHVAARARQLIDDLEEPHDASRSRLHELQEPGPEPVAGQPPPRVAHQRRAGDLGRARHPRPHLEPVDLPEGDQLRHRLRRAVRRPRARRHARSTDAYWDLVTTDIRGRARPASPGLRRAATAVDGYVSVEVAPDLARDSAGTEAAARAAPRARSPSRTST